MRAQEPRGSSYYLAALVAYTAPALTQRRAMMNAQSGVSIGADYPLSSAYDVGEDFPYDEIDARLAAEPSTQARTPNPFDAPEPDAEADAAFEAMRASLWLLVSTCLPEGNRHIDIRGVGIRVLALLFVSNPQAFGAGSVKQLAEQAGVSRQYLNQHVEHFRATYGVRSRNQLPGATRAKYSAAQSRAWARRRELEKAAADALKETSATG